MTEIVVTEEIDMLGAGECPVPMDDNTRRVLLPLCLETDVVLKELGQIRLNTDPPSKVVAHLEKAQGGMLRIAAIWRCLSADVTADEIGRVMVAMERWREILQPPSEGYPPEVLAEKQQKFDGLLQGLKEKHETAFADALLMLIRAGHVH